MINRLTIGENGKQIVIDKMDDETVRIIDENKNEFHVKRWALLDLLFKENKLFKDYMEERKRSAV